MSLMVVSILALLSLPIISTRDHLAIFHKKITKDTSKATNQMASKFIFLPLNKHFKSQCNQINLSRLTEDYSTGIYISSTKEIWGNWCDQVLYRNNSIFGSWYVMVTEIQWRKNMGPCLKSPTTSDLLSFYHFKGFICGILFTSIVFFRLIFGLWLLLKKNIINITFSSFS